MRLLAVGLMAFLAGASLVVAELKMESELRDRLKNFNEFRFPNNASEGDWLKARKYISDEFSRYGLIVKEQRFNTTVALVDRDVTVEGVNIIGIANAANMTNGIVVVGADYDSNMRQNPGPLFNNGGGIAALLETARLYAFNSKWSGVFNQTKTTIFVAFDINTKEHDVGPGKPGGWYFVNEWLWDYLNKSDTNFGGAFILDSVMNINENPNTQQTSDSFKALFPKNYETIRQNNNKGNFISSLTWPGEKSTSLKDQFTGNYRKERILKQYRLEDMTLPSSVNMNQLLGELTSQDTIHFWSFQYNDTLIPLPAVLITDTEKLRQNPCSEEGTDCTCYDNSCPVLTEEREEFVAATVRALTHTLLRRQGQHQPVSKSDASSMATLPSLLTTVIILVIGRFYQ